MGTLRFTNLARSRAAQTLIYIMTAASQELLLILYIESDKLFHLVRWFIVQRFMPHML
jgi:hypothetical protein